MEIVINFLVKRNAWLVCIYQFVVSRFVEFFGNSMDRTVMKTSSLLSYLTWSDLGKKFRVLAVSVPHIPCKIRLVQMKLLISLDHQDALWDMSRDLNRPEAC